MKLLLCSIFVFIVSISLGQSGRTVTYWEHIGHDTVLAQVIQTLNDQGESVYHLNLFLSSCTTKVYYAVPSGEKDRYVITNNFGEPTQQTAQPFLYDAKLLFNQQEFKQISVQHYKSEMKRMEAKKHKNSLKY
jgi:hypothetical protein